MAQSRRGDVSRRAALAVAGAVAGAAATLAGAGAGASGGGAGPVGTWIVTSTRAGSVPNGILVTLFADGSFLRTGNAHPTESPALGRWQQAGDGFYDVTYMALQFDTGGMFIGHRKTWLRITPAPGGDTFIGRFRVITIDIAGVESAPTEGEIRGVRLVAEPFA